MPRASLVARRVESLLGTAVISTAPVAGGDISTATRLRLNDGSTAFAKTLPHAPQGYFSTEAAGLRWLGEVRDGVPVPEILGVDEDCLVLRWIEPGRPSSEGAIEFGQRLAHTHAAGAPVFGAGSGTGAGAGGAIPPSGFIGKLPLPNRPAPTWAEFFATRRVLPYLKLARQRGNILPEDADAVERVIPRFAELVPDEPPSRTHGDLWNGNCVWAATGGVHVVDPAAHGGHRETDLAMLALFGLPFLARAMAAYTEVTPLADGWEERQLLHHLFPLLTHACMFGGSYGTRAGDAARHFL